MRNRHGSWRALAPLVVMSFVAGAVSIATVTLVSSPHPASAVLPTNYITATYYVPLFEDNARAALFAVNGNTGTQLSSTTSITVTAPGTIIYYDNWEDGYETTANVAAQATTLVLGDGNAVNGNAVNYCVPARCTGDTLPVGAVMRMNNAANPATTVVPGAIDIPRTTGVVKFDGRDKISATDSVAVTHATWPTAINALHSEMAAAFDTSRWGLQFVAPVGTNTPAQGTGAAASFTYTGMEIMAKADGTTIQIDADADINHTYEITATINEGQTYYVNGTVRQGAKVIAGKPVQVFLMTGRITSNYEDRSYQVFPTEGLVNNYIVPASTSRSDGTFPTALYIHNPQGHTITVEVYTTSITTPSSTLTIPANSTYTPYPVLAYNQNAQLKSAETFAVVAGNGTVSPVANNSNAISQDYDWGFSPIPARLLLDSVFVGWAPGSQDLSQAISDPVWLTTIAATTVYVDYDGDSSTGNLVDPNGGRYDTSIVITTPLVQTRITNPTPAPGDNDMTGAHLYTVDGTGIAVAYGEDPGTPAAQNPKATPGIDLGTTHFPVCGALCVRKTVTLSSDADGDGHIDPGDTVLWTVQVSNTDYGNLTTPRIYDTLPSTVFYVPGSAVWTFNGGSASLVSDDIVPPAGTEFPFDENGYQITAGLNVGEYATIRYETEVSDAYLGSASICNEAIVTSTRAAGDAADGSSTACITVDQMRITKTRTDVKAGEPLVVGDTVEYTIDVTNASTGVYSNIAVTDPTPTGLTHVSTSVTRPAGSNNTVIDNMDAADWTGSSGTVPWSANAWTEAGDDVGASAAAGNLLKATRGAGRVARFINNVPINASLSRAVGDLSAYTSVVVSYDVLCNGLTSGDVVQVSVSPNGGTTWNQIAQYTSCGASTTYTSPSFGLTSGQWGTNTQIRMLVTNAFGGSGTRQLSFDNVTFTVSASRTTSTVPGLTPPLLYTLTDLLPGESASIVVTYTVAANPPDQIDNYVWARSGNTLVNASTTDCVKCFDFGDDPATYDETTSSPTPGYARKTWRTETLGDTFQTATYAATTGSLPWKDTSGVATSWTETGDGTTGPTSGVIQNLFDNNERTIRIGSATATVGTTVALTRVAGNLSAYDKAFVNVTYRCSGLTAADAVQLQVSPDGGGTWNTIDTFSNCNNATTYSNDIVTLTSGQWGANTQVRFKVSQALEANKFLYIDDVQFTLTSTTVQSGPFLGSTVDREAAGSGGAAPVPAAPGAAPSGDDSIVGGTDDEDGVTVSAIDHNQLLIPFTVGNSDGTAAQFNGWLDWNNNGVFESGESIFAPGTLVSISGGATVSNGVARIPAAGPYTVLINVPDLSPSGNNSGYVIGDHIYTRFRVGTSFSDVATPIGPSADGEIEDYYSSLLSLPVSLAYVTSARHGGSIDIAWRTAQEVDNVGFNLYGKAADGSRVLLTAQPVPSKAPTSMEAQDYQMTVPSTTRAFWIEDIALDGSTALHGPFTVGRSYGDPDGSQRVDWKGKQAQNDTVTSANSAAARDASLRRNRKGGAAGISGPVAQLAVTQSGVQQVTYEQLLAGGVDLKGVRATDIAVTDRKGPVAIEVTGSTRFGPGSTIQFLGEPLDALYTATNVYWVHVDKTLAKRIANLTTAPPTAGTPVTTYAATTVVNDNYLYSVTAPGSDPWYDKFALSIGGTPKTVSTTVDIADPVAGQPATVSVDMWGVSFGPTPDQHHVRLSVNGTVISDTHFDDTARLNLQGSAPAGLLHAGSNTIDVTVVGDTGVFVDIVAVNTWSVAFQRSNVAQDGRLDLNAAGQRIDVNGLPSGTVYAYRVAANGTVSRLTTRVSAATVSVAGTPAAARYVFSAAGSVRAPGVTPMRPTADLTGGTADYVMITNGVLTSALAPLVAHHQGLGRTVKVVDVADIYQAYSHGIVDAAAIDAYLAKAVPTLGAKWVLLAGNDSFDYRNYLGLGAFSLIPSVYGPTGQSITFAPLDGAYADLDADGVPDVALGRLPARTPAELTMMIDKTLEYANTPQHSAVLASDTNDGIDYAAINDDLAARLPGWSVQRSDMDRSDIDTARNTLLGAMQQGVGLTMFLGHSSSTDWTEMGLFNTGDVAALTGPPTAVVQFGCWNTYYVAPGADSLAHTLMLDPDGGAAIVMGSSTLSAASDDIILAKFLTDQLASNQKTVGEAVLAAKKAMRQSEGSAVPDVQLGWNILGDPAILVGASA